MWPLNFISRDDLKELVLEVYEKYNQKVSVINLQTLNKNKIDPIRLIFTKNFLHQSWSDLIEDEIVRQTDKTLNNLIGEFHQKLFKKISQCNVPDQGFDVVFEPKEKIQGSDFDTVSRVYVELKNKFNTMNYSSSSDVHRKMEKQILRDDDCICALVEVISGKSKNIPWTITYNNIKHKHKRIRKISIDQFLAMVTKDELAFYKLCLVLPEIVKEVVKTSDFSPKDSTAYQELQELSQRYNTDIYNIILNMAFEDYNGFNLDQNRNT